MTWDNLHEEDILFEFRASDPDDLTPGRFYLGTVDGFAEFGVFVTLSDDVTGLLHRSKLDRRLESLDWEPGDEVIVQVEGVRDNGNIDLDWSIRQSVREFRGRGVDPEASDTDDTSDEDTQIPDVAPDAPEAPTSETDTDEKPGGGTTAIARHAISDLEDVVTERVRLEGRITDVRQTSGPTIFSLADETGAVECAAFESAGVRAYPTVEPDDVVRVIGLVDRHRGEIQIEAESIEALEGNDRTVVVDRLESAARKRARPNDDSLLLVDPVVADLAEDLITVATRLRQAVLEGRSILVRHPASADGVVAASALEHALLALFDREGSGVDGSRLVERRPMDEPWYEPGDAMYDTGHPRGDEAPLIVLVGAGASDADRAALRFLDIYSVPAVVIDAFVDGHVSETVSAAAVSQSATNVSVLAAHVAGIVDESVREAVAPLPAISFPGHPPDRYAALAADHGLDASTVRERHEAIALTAYYQRYDDKRELVGDLLFEDEAASLASHVSAQYRQRVETAVATAQRNADRLTAVDRSICVLDAEAYAHRFDFPPKPVLADELLRAEREAGNADMVVLLGTDECYVAGPVDEDLSSIADRVADRVPEGDVGATRDRLTFLSGARNTVREALVEVLVDGDAA